MEIQDDVRTATGLRLLSAGQTVTPALNSVLGTFLRLDAVLGTGRLLTASTAYATLSQSDSSNTPRAQAQTFVRR